MREAEGEVSVAGRVRAKTGAAAVTRAEVEEDMTAGGQIGGREAPGERTPEARVEHDPSTVRRVRADGGIAPQ
jgi:hypothetical protein